MSHFFDSKYVVIIPHKTQSNIQRLCSVISQKYDGCHVVIIIILKLLLLKVAVKYTVWPKMTHGGSVQNLWQKSTTKRILFYTKTN